MSEFTEELEARMTQLKEKYDIMGQDLKSYLDGLLYSNYLTYWDYIHLDTLLTLQNPKTDFPDENIFIVYHQITELYFNLSLHEFFQLANNGARIMPNGENKGWRDKLQVNYFIQRLTRINKYFEALTKSFEIMIEGMEKEQFLRFRMALLPGSGFQSVQYRKIEMCSTDFINLVAKDKRADFKADSPIKEMMEHIYWKEGAIELKSKQKTLTLRQFEKKYTADLLKHAYYYKEKNVWKKYLSLPEEDRENPELIMALKQLDVNVNINWPLVHYKSAVRYLQAKESDIEATGGTNWQRYLPPRFQKRIFFPDLWSEEEKEKWGKSWVDSMTVN